MFTTEIHGMVLQTWFRPADFEMAPDAQEARRDRYPMGTVVTLMVDLPLMESRDDAAIVTTLSSGDMAILAITGDIK